MGGEREGGGGPEKGGSILGHALWIKLAGSERLVKLC